MGIPWAHTYLTENSTKKNKDLKVYMFKNIFILKSNLKKT